MQTKSKKTLKPLNRGISQAIPIVASAYGEKFGININIGGDMAYTDGGTINLPLVNDSFSTDVYWGYLAHECAHVRFTDFSVQVNDGPVGSLTNIIEDVRIELLFEDLYPGTKVDLDAIMDHIAKKFGFQTDPKAHPMAVAINYLLVRMNADYLNRKPCINEKANHDCVAKEMLPEGWFIQVDALLNKHMPVSSTRDSRKLADLLLKALKKAEDDEEKPIDNGAGKGKSNTSLDENDSTINADQANDTSNKGNANQSDGSDADGNSQQLTKDGSTDQSKSSASGDTSDSKKEKKGKRSAFSAISQNELPKTAHEIAQEELNVHANYSSQMDQPVAAKNIDRLLLNDSDFVNDALRHSAKLRAKLLALVQARDRSQPYIAQNGKRVKSSRLTRIPVGETRIYKRQDVKKAPNTAVHLLLDNSGSMNGSRQAIANSATAAIAVALNSLPKTDVAASAFPGIGGRTHVAPLFTRKGMTATLTNRCNIVSTGYTPMAEAMLFCYQELAKTEVDRKILLVITDGDANNPELVKHLNSHADILSLALVIGNHDPLEGMFDYSVLIDDISKLQQKTFELVDKVI